MLSKLRKMKNKGNERVNKEIENIIKNQAENLELNIQNWIETLLEVFNWGLDQVEKVIARLKERSFEIIQLKEQKKRKKKRLHKSEGSLKDSCAQSLQLCLLFETPWTVAYQNHFPCGFSKQEYWSGLPCPPPRHLPDRDWTSVSYATCIGRRIVYH